jgi:3'5'-cyclic nucleotide phosphodiesterase
MWLQVCGDEMLSALGMLLKCADVGHMTQPFANHRVWVRFFSHAALFIPHFAPCTFCMLVIVRAAFSMRTLSSACRSLQRISSCNVHMLEHTLQASSRFFALQVEALTEEFYQQGDREKVLGMQPLPFMDREKGQDIASAQVCTVRHKPCALLVQTLR